MNVDLIPADEPDDEPDDSECEHEWDLVEICRHCGVSGYVHEPDDLP